MTKKLLAVLVMISLPLYAILGIGDIVDSPIADMNAMVQIGHMIDEYGQLLLTYQTTVNTYNQIQNAARQITGKGAWEFVRSAIPTAIPPTPNSMGSSGSWSDTLNTGLRNIQAWDQATMQMSSPSGLMSSLGSYEQGRLANYQATLELNDAIAKNAMSASGSTRSVAAQRAASLAMLQAASLSDDPALNTATGIANKTNVGVVAVAQAVHDQNALMASLVDQQNIAMKERHDAMANAINVSVASSSKDATQATISTLWGGDSSVRSTLPGSR